MSGLHADKLRWVFMTGLSRK